MSAAVTPTYLAGTVNEYIRAQVQLDGVSIVQGTSGQTVQMCIVPEGTAPTSWQPVATWVDGYPALLYSMPTAGVFHVYAEVTTATEGPVVVDCGAFIVRSN